MVFLRGELSSNGKPEDDIILLFRIETDTSLEYYST
jgi:hypothetical protein